jgi:5-methylcytosine-specific restriction enzyme A
MATHDHKAPWDAWYKTPRWKRVARHQLRRSPWCKECHERGVLGVPAQVVDHVMPHHGNQISFWFGPLQSLCKPCHDSRKKFVESRGFDNEIGPDGWPTDSRHPFYHGHMPRPSKPKSIQSNRIESARPSGHLTGGVRPSRLSREGPRGDPK